MFRDTTTAAAVCQALMTRAGPPGIWWDEEGPTAGAKELYESDGGGLPPDQRLTVLTAWALWRGSGGPRLVDLARIDAGTASLLAGIVCAVAEGPDAVDAWLREPRSDG